MVHVDDVEEAGRLADRLLRLPATSEQPRDRACMLRLTGRASKEWRPPKRDPRIGKHATDLYKLFSIYYVCCNALDALLAHPCVQAPRVFTRLVGRGARSALYDGFGLAPPHLLQITKHTLSSAEVAHLLPTWGNNPNPTKLLVESTKFKTSSPQDMAKKSNISNTTTTRVNKVAFRRARKKLEVPLTLGVEGA